MIKISKRVWTRDCWCMSKTRFGVGSPKESKIFFRRLFLSLGKLVNTKGLLSFLSLNQAPKNFCLVDFSSAFPEKMFESCVLSQNCCQTWLIHTWAVVLKRFRFAKRDLYVSLCNMLGPFLILTISNYSSSQILSSLKILTFSIDCFLFN